MKQSIIYIISYIVILASIQCSKCDDLSSKSEVDDLFTCLKKILKQGIPFVFGSLDPLNIAHYEWNSENLWIYGKYEFDRLIFTGLSTFSYRDFSVSPIEEEQMHQVNCKMSFNLKLVGSYRMDGIIFDIAAVKGDGNLTMNTNPVELDFTMKFNKNCKDLACFKDAHLDIRMQSDVNITGLEPNARMSSLISRQLKSIIDDLFNENAEIVDAFLDPILNELIASLPNIEFPPGLLGTFLKIYLFLFWKSCSKQFSAVGQLLGEE